MIIGGDNRGRGPAGEQARHLDEDEGAPVLVSDRITYAPDATALVADRATILGSMMQITADRAVTGLSLHWGAIPSHA